MMFEMGVYNLFHNCLFFFPVDVIQTAGTVIQRSRNVCFCFSAVVSPTWCHLLTGGGGRAPSPRQARQSGACGVPRRAFRREPWPWAAPRPAASPRPATCPATPPRPNPPRRHGSERAAAAPLEPASDTGRSPAGRLPPSTRTSGSTVPAEAPRNSSTLEPPELPGPPAAAAARGRGDPPPCSTHAPAAAVRPAWDLRWPMRR